MGRVCHQNTKVSYDSMSIEDFYIPLLVILRAIAFSYTAPLIGSKFLPGKVKIYLSIVLGLITFLQVDGKVNFSGEGFYFSVIANLMVGALLGILLSVLLNFLSIGGHFIAMGSGLGFATMADPSNGTQTTTLASFYKISGFLIFVCMGGILSLTLVLSGSFSMFPLELSQIPNITSEYVLSFFAFSLESALLVAAPMIFTVFLMNISFGIISKASPGLSVFSIGFPLGILITFFVMSLSIDMLPYFISNLLNVIPLLVSGDTF